MSHGHVDLFEPEQGSGLAARKLRSDHVILAELSAVLVRHPGGLRRWSVMRAIRKERERTGQDIPQNFEAEVERTFRRFCADVDAKTGGGAAKDALFFRPSEKAGEVWAILRDRASSWRNDELVEVI
jgi:hypothetical protein